LFRKKGLRNLPEKLTERGFQMQRGYALLWSKIWANPVLCESGRKFSRLEAWL
jgi:hypothetical protein